MASHTFSPRPACLPRQNSGQLQRARSGLTRRLSCPPPFAASSDYLGDSSSGGGDRWDEWQAELQQAIAEVRARDVAPRPSSPTPWPEALSGRPPSINEAQPPPGLSPLSDSWDLEDDTAAADLSLSWPSTTDLTGGERGSRPAREPLEFFPTSHLDLDWGSGSSGSERAAASGAGACPTRRSTFVILFGVNGQAETEGIYSLRSKSLDDGLPFDTVVAFESEDDAQRYACLLEASMEHVPSVWPIEWGELLDFCNAAGYRCRLEPAGSLLIPPEYNVSLTDWERTLRLRQGDWSVLAEEPQRGVAGATPATTSASQQPQQPVSPKEQYLRQEQQRQQQSSRPQFAELVENADWQEVLASAAAAARDAEAAALSAPPAGAEAGNAVELTSEELAQVKQRLEALLRQD